MSYICPVCHQESIKTKCNKCGFGIPTFVFLSKDDANKWYLSEKEKAEYKLRKEATQSIPLANEKKQTNKTVSKIIKIPMLIVSIMVIVLIIFFSITVGLNGRGKVAVTDLTVNPSNTTVTKGQNCQFIATVNGYGNPSQSVTWRVIGGENGTSISSTGLLTIAANESATSFSVIATSTVDTSKNGSATITVYVPDTHSMVLINGGTFTMGSPSNEHGRYNNEGPQHQVTVSSFYMGKYEVTQKEYQEVMGTNPSYFKGDNLPVDDVTWNDAIKYCNQLSKKEGLNPAYTMNGLDVEWNQNANGYRLPTEMEWEYACRAGTMTAYNTGENISDNTGWYNYNSGGKSHPVGQKPTNAWGLYDMHGNISEWCWDRYKNYSSDVKRVDSSWNSRVFRGGYWNGLAEHLRSAYRGSNQPYYGFNFIGFRLARSYNSDETSANSQSSSSSPTQQPATQRPVTQQPTKQQQATQPQVTQSQSTPVPTPPRNVRTETVGTDRITLNWDSAGSGMSYQVYYSTKNDLSSAITLGNPTTATSMIISKLVSNTNYYFWVSSIQNNRESDKSSVLTVRTTVMPEPIFPLDGTKWEFINPNTGTRLKLWYFGKEAVFFQAWNMEDTIPLMQQWGKYKLDGTTLIEDYDETKDNSADHVERIYDWKSITNKSDPKIIYTQLQ